MIEVRYAAAECLIILGGQKTITQVIEMWNNIPDSEYKNYNYKMLLGESLYQFTQNELFLLSMRNN